METLSVSLTDLELLISAVVGFYAVCWGIDKVINLINRS